MIAYKLKEKDKEVIELLSNDLKKLSFDFYRSTLDFLIIIKELVIEYLGALKEYRYANIKKYGLFNIIKKRAYLFFGVEEEVSGSFKKTKVKIDVKSVKKGFKRLLKLVLFPFYLVVIILKISTKTNKNRKNNVTNQYRI